VDASELAPLIPHDWVSFTDADGDVWMFDASFLCSRWTCIFGRGCRGVLDHDATELVQGCCSHGAHFSDAADRKRVQRLAGRLRPDQWQFHEVAADIGGPIHRNDDGDWVTELVDEACIFLNRPDFPGGAGCALHRAALEVGERPLDWKPEVCWQLPLRLTATVDENGRTTRTLREWQRRDWGEGGEEFHWWCTESDEAFVGHRPVYEELADEIRELVGDEPYEWFVAHVESRPRSHVLTHPAQLLPNPARRRRSATTSNGASPNGTSAPRQVPLK
jgi:hypothetical protein